MKQIALTKGMIALVDDEDFDRLNQYSWHYVKKPKDKTGYAVKLNKLPSAPSTYKYQRISMQNMISRCPEGFHWDHINRDGLDNRKCNLRQSTVAENNRNQWKRNDSKNEYRGVHIRSKNYTGKKKWCARIRVNGVRFCSKGFATEREAAEEYNRMAIKYHGEFAGLNEF